MSKISSRSSKVLNVFLHAEHIGTLTALPGDRIIFSFLDSYIHNERRKTLSLSFYDRLNELITNVRPTQLKAPPFFSNLLPEGVLRRYLAAQIDTKPQRDFPLLELLGEDLPGAITILPAEETAVREDELESESDKVKKPLLKFSLAGVQMKFSALANADGGLTIPAHGVGGDHIVKLPSFRFDHVSENEFSMMTLACLVGLSITSIELIDMQQVAGLPKLPETLPAQKALQVKRFDRPTPGKKTHIEDMTQVYGVYSENKYNKVSYGNILNLLATVGSIDDVRGFIQQIVFSALIGNADMHLKNISLIYKDGVNASLSPAYDLVSTIPYLEDDKMALSVNKVKKMGDINLTLLLNLAEQLRLPQAIIKKTLHETVDKTQQHWPEVKKMHLLKKSTCECIEKHINAIAKSILI